MEAFRKEKAVERGNASVAIHNMKENGSDMRHVHELFNFLKYNEQIVNTARTGKYDKLF